MSVIIVTIPFTYYIRNKTTGQHYYGARWRVNCHPSDLWTKYFTSSNKVKRLIEQYGKDDFHVEVRKTFDNVEDCKRWERGVLKRLKVVGRTDWLNKSCAIPPSHKGVKWSEERRQRTIGKKMSDMARYKLSQAKMGWKPPPISPETRAKLSAARKGKKRGPYNNPRQMIAIYSAFNITTGQTIQGTRFFFRQLGWKDGCLPVCAHKRKTYRGYIISRTGVIYTSKPEYKFYGSMSN